MAPIDELKKKIQSGKLDPLVFQFNGESIVVVPDGHKFLCHKFLCPKCLVEGKELKDSIYQCTTYCQQPPMVKDSVVKKNAATKKMTTRSARPRSTNH